MSNLPLWKAEVNHPELCEHLREGLRQVKDPELGMDIIQLGLIRDVDIQSDSANLTMILTTPFCPYAPAMMEQTRKKAEETLERPTKIEMGTEYWDRTMMEDGAADDWGLMF
jgi:metal-sulfur cluster biosynthetic enzyme